MIHRFYVIAYIMSSCIIVKENAATVARLIARGSITRLAASTRTRRPSLSRLIITYISKWESIVN